MLKPLMKNMYNLQIQTGKMKKDINDLSQQVSKLAFLNDKLKNLKSDYALYGKIFPKEGELLSLVENISAIAKISKVAISALNLAEAGGDKQTAPAGILREVPIDINVKGGYHQIGSFVNKLETMDKIIRIKSMEITYEDVTPKKHNLKLSVVTYMLKT